MYCFQLQILADDIYLKEHHIHLRDTNPLKSSCIELIDANLRILNKSSCFDKNSKME